MGWAQRLLDQRQLCPDDVIANYRHLWQIEKAFRTSKTDLKVRPVYHYLKRRIEAHICISFCAYKTAKNLRFLKMGCFGCPSAEVRKKAEAIVLRTASFIPNKFAISFSESVYCLTIFLLCTQSPFRTVSR